MDVTIALYMTQSAREKTHFEFSGIEGPLRTEQTKVWKRLYTTVNEWLTSGLTYISHINPPLT